MARKREACEVCGKSHFSPAQQLRCLEKRDRQTCTCPRYWRRRWLSHARDCVMYGQVRRELETEETEWPTETRPTGSDEQPQPNTESWLKSQNAAPRRVRRKGPGA